MTLTETKIQTGRSLLEALDNGPLKADAAFWVKFPDANDWKLAISVSGSRSPMDVYKSIQDVIKNANIQSFRLDDVALMKPDAPLLKLTKSMIRTGDAIAGIDFRNNSINGQLVPDMYIYRMK